MSRSAQIPYTGGLQVYYKLGPPTNDNPSSTPSWEDEVQLFFTAVNGIVNVPDLIDGQTYYFFAAASENTPQSTDVMVGIDEPSVAVTDIDDINTQLEAITEKTNLIGTAAAPVVTPDGGSHYARVGSTENVTIVCTESIAAKTVRAVIETTRSKTDIATVVDASITKVTTSATFALPSAATTVERTLRITIRDTTTHRM